MSPTIFVYGSYRFFFFSREEPRIHVHVACPNGHAKFWIEPIVALADFSGKISKKELKEIQSLVEERHDEIRKAWKEHFQN